MSGGYRCSLGHSWQAAQNATACPVCGDTTIVLANNPAEPVFVVTFDQHSRANGQDATQSIPGVTQEDHATATFQPREPKDQSQQQSDPSFDSLAKMLIPESS